MFVQHVPTASQTRGEMYEQVEISTYIFFLEFTIAFLLYILGG